MADRDKLLEISRGRHPVMLKVNIPDGKEIHPAGYVYTVNPYNKIFFFQVDPEIIIRDALVITRDWNYMNLVGGIEYTKLI